MASEFLTIDCSQEGGSGQILRSSLAFSVLTGRKVHLKNICTGYTRPGLSSSKIALVSALAQATAAKTTGVGLGSTEVLFSPQKQFSQKRISVELTQPGACSLVLDGLLLPALFCGKRISITVYGLTHSKRSPSISFYKEVFAKYLRPYLKDFSLTVEKTGFYPGQGKVQLIIEGKYTLQDVIPSMNISRTGNLVAILAQLNSSGQYAEEAVQKRINHLLSVAFREEHAPFRLESRIVPSSEEAMALLLVAYYGDRDSYDNDRAFVIGKDAVYDPQEGDINSFILHIAQEFKEQLASTALDSHTAELLAPLLILVGGQIPVLKATKHLKAIAALAKDFFDLDLLFKNAHMSCVGHLQEVHKFLPVEDL